MTSSLECVLFISGRDEASYMPFWVTGVGGGGRDRGNNPHNLIHLLLLPRKESLFPFLYDLVGCLTYKEKKERKEKKRKEIPLTVVAGYIPHPEVHKISIQKDTLNQVTLLSPSRLVQKRA